MIRTLILATAVTLLAVPPALASDRDDALAPIKAFIAAIDKNDMAAAAATHVAAPSIIDEFPRITGPVSPAGARISASSPRPTAIPTRGSPS